VKRLALAFVLLLTACAQSRAEERAIEHALGLGFVSPTADCDAERKDLPGFLICDVQEGDPEAEQRGFRVACLKGFEDGPCVDVPPNGTFGVSGGKS
jgi:hypothetical protein